MNLDNNIKILVLEDHPGFAQLLMVMLKELDLRSIHIVGDYEAALKSFEQQRPDLCLIDIDLGSNQKTGIEFAEAIREQAPFLPIVYLTANYTEDYYERCRHTRPSSFMNKELSRLKLFQAIELALIHPKEESPAPPQSPPTAAIPPAAAVPYLDNQHLFFKVGDVYKNIPIKEISFFYANGKMTFARVDKRNFPTSVQLKTLEDELFPQFLRIHKSYLVNVRLIESINTREDKVELGGETLPIGYTYRKDFFDQLKLLK